VHLGKLTGGLLKPRVQGQLGQHIETPHLLKKKKTRKLGNVQGCKPSVVTHTVIPATWEAESGRSQFEASLGKKF
jgi:hypothetical protein